MQSNLLPQYQNLKDRRVLLSLSGGINSAAVLCYLCSEYPQDMLPDRLWIFYSHLTEHSPGTLRFVRDCIAYARKQFELVCGFHFGSVNKFFQDEGFIAHPILSPCSDHLKQIPAMQFKAEHGIEIDLIGYVKEERRRIKRQVAKGMANAAYPVSMLSNEDCFELVQREIGWYPAIYDIRFPGGRRVFSHNNCLPCKNMDGYLQGDGSCSERYDEVRRYYPAFFERARQTAQKTGGYWGRPSDFDGYCKHCEFPSIEDLPLFAHIG